MPESVPAPTERTPTQPPPQTIDRGPVDELVDLLQRELEATTDLARRADLQVRLAFLTWDLLGDVDSSHRHAVAAAGEHPLSARILLAQALSETQPERVAALLDPA